MAVKMSLRLIVILLLLDPAARHAEAQTAPRRPVKHALLIGVSDYSRGGDPQNEWWNLASTSDVDALHTVLVAKLGFQDAEIVSLTSRADTTRTSILDNLNAL